MTSSSSWVKIAMTLVFDMSSFMRASFLAALLCVVAADIVCAQKMHVSDSGGIITTHDTGDGPLKVEYFNELSGSHASGTLHVRVSTTKGPSISQRDLDITFFTHFPGTANRVDTAYHLPIVLSEGSSSVESAIPYYPAVNVYRNSLEWDIGVREGGRNMVARRDRSASQPRVNGIANNFYHAQELTDIKTSNFLWLTDDSTQHTSLQPHLMRLLLAGAGTLQTAVVDSALSKTEFGVSGGAASNCVVRSLNSAPDRWQYYLGYRMVVLHLSELEELRAHAPTVAEALRRYVAAGGNMLLIGNAEYEGRNVADLWLQGDKLRSESMSSLDAAASQRLWEGVDAEKIDWWLRDYDGSALGVLESRMNAVAAAQSMSQGLYDLSAGMAAGTNAESTVGFGMRDDPLLKDATSVVGIKPAHFWTLGDCARDGLIALKTYAKSEFGITWDVIGEFISIYEIYSNNTIYGGTGYSPVGTASWPVPSDQFGNAFTFSRDSIQGIWEGGLTFINGAIDVLDRERPRPFAVRDFGLGHLAIIEPSLDSYPIDHVSAGLGNFTHAISNTASSRIDGVWPYRNLIQSVGRPPVWMFCSIVLLFGIAIGPGLLTLTGWMRRRSLLIFLVPALSLVATALIVSFEVLHEGFSTSIRISAVTAIDELTGQSFSWSRQTYFSGSPPRGGLKIPKEVYFRAVSDQSEYVWTQDVEPSRAAASQIWIDENELTWKSWLGAREQQQVLIGHPAQHEAPLQVRRIDAQSIVVRNISGSALPFALVRDGEAGYYVAENIGVGEEVECTREPRMNISGAMARLRAQFIPEVPVGLENFRGYRTTQSDGRVPVDVLDSTFDRFLPDVEELPRYGFATLVESSDGLFVPVPGNITDSRNLIVGRLAW